MGAYERRNSECARSLEETALGLLQDDGIRQGVGVSVVIVGLAGAVVEVDGHCERGDARGSGDIG